METPTYIYIYIFISLIWEAARLCLCTPMHPHVCKYCTKFLGIKLQGFGEDPGRRSWQWSFEWKGAECRGVCFDFLGEEFNVGHGGACFWQICWCHPELFRALLSNPFESYMYADRYAHIPSYTCSQSSWHTHAHTPCFPQTLQAAVGLAESFDQVKAQGITRGRWA